MGQEIEEFVLKLNIEFSASNLARLMNYIGLLDTGAMPEAVDFNQLIFLRSSTDEIYSALERELIQQIGNVFLFPEERKNIARGSIPCRIIAADLFALGGDTRSAVLFMKICIKALDGWTLFVLRLLDGIHVGMKMFERDEMKNCTLCEASKIEDVLNNIMWSNTTMDFLPYYSIVYESVYPFDATLKDYDELAIRRRGIQYNYIETIEIIAKQMKLDMANEIRRYEQWFDEGDVYPFSMELEDALEDLQDVKSSRVNTLEMLFEAEELEKISTENEQEYIQTISSASLEKEPDIEILNIAGKNPEEMIKLLKEKKGFV